MLSDLGRDLRYAVRSLLRAPALGLTIVATLALGVGANTVVFTAVNAVLLSDRPAAEPDRLVEVYTASSTPHGSSSYPDYFDLRDSGTFSSLAAFAPVGMTLDAHGETAPDPLTFGVGCAALTAACLAASAIPAVRAMRVDPATVLRRA